MRYIVLLVFASVILFVAALPGNAQPVAASVSPAPIVFPLDAPLAQITQTLTQTCGITLSWWYVDDQGHDGIQGPYSSQFYQPDHGSATWPAGPVPGGIGVAPYMNYWDIFYITGTVPGDVMTVTTYGQPPHVSLYDSRWNPSRLGYYKFPNFYMQDVHDITNMRSVFTVTEAITNLAVGQNVGRLYETYIQSGYYFNWSWILESSRGICTPECGTPGIIVDTHFVHNVWTKSSGTIWRYSTYQMPGSGYIQQAGNFNTAAQYSMTVRVLSDLPGNYLSMSIGDQTVLKAIPDQGSFSTVTAVFTVTGGIKNVTLGNGAGQSALITVDQVCITMVNSSIPYGNCINADPHFVNQSSWTPTTGINSQWNPSDAYGANGMWYLGQFGGGPEGSIYQNILPSAMPSGQYTVSLLSRATNQSSDAVFTIADQSVHIEWNMPTDGEYSFYSGVFSVTNTSAPIHIVLSNDGDQIAADYICISPIVSTTTPITSTGPCGISTRDMTDSSLYFLSNGTFENNIGGAVVSCPASWIDVSLSFPWGVSYSPFGNCVESHPGIVALNSWSKRAGTAFQGFYGVLRSGPYGYSAGLIPLPLNNGIAQQIATPSRLSGGFNVVWRGFRTYGNSRFIINNSAYIGSDTGAAANTWGQYAAWFSSGNETWFNSDCGGTVCATMPGQTEKTPDAAIVDDVYIVPGPSLCSGGAAACLCSGQPPTLPPSNCINTLADAGWQTVGHASIENVSSGNPWAVIPADNSAIQRYMPVATAANSWQEANAMLSAAMSATISVDARCQNTGTPCGITIYGNASTPDQSYTTAYFGCSGSQACSGVITHTFNPAASNAMIRIQNTGEAQGGETWSGTTLVSSVCINRGSAPPPTTGGCLGKWLSSLTDVEVGPGVEIPFEYNAYNTSSPLNGSYTVQASGSFLETPDVTPTLTLMYTDGSRQEIIQSPSMGFPSFSAAFSFVTPPGGYTGGRLVLQATHDLEYSSVCLKSGSTTTPGPGGPFPQCFQNGVTTVWIDQGVLFPPYTSTTGSGLDVAAMLTYNYAIYPLGCEILRISDYEVGEFRYWMRMLDGDLMIIISLLQQILDKMGQGPPSCGLFDVIWYIIRKLFELLGLILSMIGRALGMVIDILDNISLDIRTGQPTSYPIECDEQGQYMCLALGGLIAVERLGFGEWLMIMSFIGITMLTIPLGLWIVDQVRAMLQPGSGGSNAE